MKVAFRKSFVRDLKKIKDKEILNRVQRAIEEVETVDELGDIIDVKKLSGTVNCYRIRVGDHRIGITLEEDTVEFIRCLPRRDLYRYFP